MTRVAIACGFMLMACSPQMTADAGTGGGSGGGGSGGGSGGAVANPALLPAATGQRPGPGTYGRNLPAGGTYVDPVSGVTVLKLTSATVPNDGETSHNHGYANGGPFISQPWEFEGHTFYTVSVNTGWIADVRYDTLEVSNYRAVPAEGEIGIAFSLDPATPRIAYVADRDNRRINRYNTQTNAIENTGTWPWQTTQPAGWLQTQVNDTWIVALLDDATVIARRRSDGLVRTFPNRREGVVIDEPHLDLTDPFVYLSVDSMGDDNLPWDLENDTVPSNWSTVANGTGGGMMSDDHATPLRGGMASTFGEGDPEYWGAAYLQRSPLLIQGYIVGYENYMSFGGDWYQSGYGNAFGFQGAFTDQWIVANHFRSGSGGKIVSGVIGMVSLKGDVRFLVADDTTAANYGSYPKPACSPDGKLVLWSSDMNGQMDTQVFLAKVPTN